MRKTEWMGMGFPEGVKSQFLCQFFFVVLWVNNVYSLNISNHHLQSVELKKTLKAPASASIGRGIQGTTAHC